VDVVVSKYGLRGRPSSF